MMQPHVMAAAVSWVLRDAHDAFPAVFGAFSRGSAPAAVAALWQGAAVALFLALCLQLAPRVSAAHRFAAWATGFAVVASLPFMPLIVPRVMSLIAHGAVSSQFAAVAPQAAAKPWLQFDSHWGLAIAVLWLAASAIRAAALGYHSLRLRKLWKTATPIQHAAALATDASPRRPIEICTTPHLDHPCVIGFFAPRILIPDWLIEHLTPGELKQIVLHEAEHLRRRDDWINLLEKLALVLFPLNPALAWIERRLCREREMACDEGVVRKTHAPRAYAACLTSLAERRLQRGATRGLDRELERRAEALSLAAWRRRPELVHRVQSILRGKQSLHPLAARVLVAVVGCGLLVASVELARCPQMVAFVAAPQPHPASIAQLQRSSGRDNDMPQAESGFRAIPAKAIVPANALAPAPIGDAPLDRAHRRPPRQAASAVASSQAAAESRQQLTELSLEASSRETNLEAAIPSASASQETQTQYIVLAAWEVVETTRQGSREIADYDTGASAQPEIGATATQPGSKPFTKIAITRVILAVYPVPAAPAPVSGSQQPSSSKPVRPPAPPAASGWLVLQL